MRKPFNLVQLFTAALLIVGLTLGCAPAEVAPTAAPATSPPPAEPVATEPPAPEESLRVALVLPGSISDKGFNQSAYEGLLMIESELGAETAPRMMFCRAVKRGTSMKCWCTMPLPSRLA